MAKRSTKQADNRRPNIQPNHLPPFLTLVIALITRRDAAGTPTEVVHLGRDENGNQVPLELDVPQNDKLSEKGNISFKAGVSSGLPLPGLWTDTLQNLAVMLMPIPAYGITEPVALTSTAVRQSESGNPLVMHHATLELPGADGVALRHQVQFKAWFVVKKGSYGLDAQVSYFPAAESRGPTIRGTLRGMEVEAVAATNAMAEVASMTPAVATVG